MEIFVCRDYPLKLFGFRFEKECCVIFEAMTAHGRGRMDHGKNIVTPDRTENAEFVSYYDPMNTEYEGSIAFVGAAVSGAAAAILPQSVRISVSGVSPSNGAVFFLGASMNERYIKDIVEKINVPFYENERTKAREFALSMIPPIKIDVKNGSLSAFMPFCAYQAFASRFIARSGFYQSGGAYGFRDQLQDCLCIVYSSPQTVRTHIIRCAARQYQDGSVQHWWHPLFGAEGSKGLKSRCSDDYLFLPFVTADYVKKTSDRSVLFQEIRYLDSPPLEEAERYESAEKSGIKETVFKHCLRALSYGEKFGKHGLILMGSCDWNDGFSHVGREGRGESVFSTLFYIYTVDSFMYLLEEYEPRAAEYYKDLVKKIRASFEKHCFDQDHYIRAFYDDGSSMGKSGDEACGIDLLPQSFAAITGCGDKDAVSLSLKRIYERLYDKKYKIIRLFSPAFGPDTKYAGYINAYPKGLRENGGQYTHAAVWAAKAMLDAGETEIGLEFMSALNPASRCSDHFLAERYKAEPYFISADIYYAKGLEGRAGWSLYTGSAAWYYKV
ncbi:MAG: hypothetical protein IJS94_03790, partial [Clostridia bacterium]|nr:hypothetical protein [Clostridia bacterium]